MTRIKIVEDDPNSAKVLVDCIERYGKENAGVSFRTEVYDGGLAFLDSYRSDADIVFMDIRLPDIDGMEVCRRLRLVDRDVVIIFITDLAQYAVKGYEVDALEFIVKPLNYYSFAMKMKKAVDLLSRRGKKYILIYTDKATVRLDVDTIVFIEIMAHDMVYHTEDGDYSAKGTLKAVEAELGEGFERCSNCYLVNLAHVTSIRGNTITVGEDGNTYELQVSRPRRKDFFKRLVDYYGGVV